MRVPGRCRIAGCAGRIAPDFPAQTAGFCAAHLQLASASSRTLLQSAAKRLLKLQQSWDDETRFNAVVARGRYLAFCMLLQAAHDRLDRASARVAEEVLAAARPSARLRPVEIAARDEGKRSEAAAFPASSRRPSNGD